MFSVIWVTMLQRIQIGTTTRSLEQVAINTSTTYVCYDRPPMIYTEYIASLATTLLVMLLPYLGPKSYKLIKVEGTT
jgi:hypothetical protein